MRAFKLAQGKSCLSFPFLECHTFISLIGFVLCGLLNVINQSAAPTFSLLHYFGDALSFLVVQVRYESGLSK